jgi:hypothetical protein
VFFAAVFLIKHLSDEETVLYETKSGKWDIVVHDAGDGIRQLRFGRKDVRQSQVKVSVAP